MAQNSLWASYKLESLGLHTIELDWGLASYCLGNDCLFIDEFYIRPDFRRNGYGRKLLEMIKSVAIEAGKPSIRSTVSLNNKTSVLSLQAQLAGGFVPIKAENGMILLSLELGGISG